MASLKSRFSINRVSPKFFLLMLPILLVIPVIFNRVKAQTFTEAQGVSSDVGLMDGESDEGCRYSNQEGLVYFCGYVKSAENYEPLEGITVAVYEELADGPSLLEPDGIFSPTGKWGGNLAHLFSSTSTNAQGHYEIIARQGRDIHIAFLCGDEFVGGLKRIEEISRIEVLNDLVTCPVKGYTEPPPQLRYTDRSDFLECSVNFLGTLIQGAKEADHFVDTVGLSGTPNFLLNSRIQVQNFDFRFMSLNATQASLNVSGWFPVSLLENALDLDWYLRPGESVGFLGAFSNKGRGFVRDGAGWIGARNHGAWRMHDCRATYEFYPSSEGFSPRSQPCESDKMSLWLASEWGEFLPYDEDLYLVLNQLPYMPRFPATVAWARIDIRNSIRQVVKDSAQEVRQGDALWDNYIGEVPRVYQKSPEGDPAQAERLEVKNESDAIISCDELAIQSADISKRYISSSLSGLANPVEIPSDIMEGGLMTDWEYDYPVCRGASGNKTMREVCIDHPNDETNKLLCRAAMWCAKGAGGSVTPHRSQDDSDSMQRDDTIRQSIFNVKNNAANDGGNTEEGTAWAGQEWEVNAGSRANVHNFNYMCGGFLLGREYEGKNYLNQYGNPTVMGPTDNIGETGDNCEEVEVEGNLLDDDPSNDVIIELKCETEEAANVGLGETPTGGLIEQPSPNAIKNDVVVQDVGTNNIAHCSVSTMFENLFFDQETGAPAGAGAEDGVNKKLELLTYDDLRQPLDNKLARAAYTVLYNFFYGVPQHNEDMVVGSGTYYTALSYKRDKLLALRGIGASLDRRAKQASRDIFDSMRTLASRGIVVDFATISGGDIAAGIVTLFGGEGANLLEVAMEVVNGVINGTPDRLQKSYAHRKSIEVTNPNLAVMVGYPFWEEPELGEEADPFKLAFKQPTAPWIEDSWGNSDSYPWRSVPEGSSCMTYVDWPYYNLPGEEPFLDADLYVEVEADEDHEYRYQADSEGLSRTCRIDYDNCYVWNMTYACTDSYPGHMENPGNGPNPGNLFYRPEEEPFEDDDEMAPHSEIRVRLCDTQEREMCAIKRYDTDRFNDYYETWGPLHGKPLNTGSCACRWVEKDKNNDDDTDDPGETYWECPGSVTKEVVDCALDRAGPYSSPGRMDTKIQNKVTQDSLAPDREEVVPVDGMKEVSDQVAYAFQSPAKMNRQPEYEFIKEYDLAHSKTVDQDADPVTGNPGLISQGYPVKSVGGVNKGIYDPGSHPYTGTEVIADNGIFLHCEEPDIPLPAGVSMNHCTDNPGPYNGEGFPVVNCWKCPIAPLPKCKGLFGEMEGIDEIVISPNGETAIKMNFDFDAFEDMLEIYTQVEEETGVPCEVMAALHFREAGNKRGQSIHDGKALRGGDVLEDALTAADHLLSKKSSEHGRCTKNVGTPRVPKGLAIKNITDLMQMISHWGGGGNDNCNPSIFHLTDYEDLHMCPADYRCGEYDGYVTAFMDSDHEDMAIIWPMDKIDVNTSIVSLETLEAMFGPEAVGGGGSTGPIGTGGIRADAACYVIAQEATNRGYSAVAALCPPPIPELRPGALTMAKYIYEFSVGIRQP